jgi:hypothetical protein
MRIFQHRKGRFLCGADRGRELECRDFFFFFGTSEWGGRFAWSLCNTVGIPQQNLQLQTNIFIHTGNERCWIKFHSCICRFWISNLLIEISGVNLKLNDIIPYRCRFYLPCWIIKYQQSVINSRPHFLLAINHQNPSNVFFWLTVKLSQAPGYLHVIFPQKVRSLLFTGVN